MVHKAGFELCPRSILKMQIAKGSTGIHLHLASSEFYVYPPDLSSKVRAS